MKKFTTLFKICFAVIILSMVSCSSDDSNPSGPGTIGGGNTGDLRLFAIDTAKVNTISMTGTNENTVLNRLFNSSSYFGAFSLSTDGKKFVYADHQMTGAFPNFVNVNEIRIANSDGTDDVKIYELLDNQAYIDMIRLCSDGKIFFTLFKPFPANTSQAFVMNSDGTGIETKSYNGPIVDVSDNRQYYLIETSTGVQILDANLDNGAGGVYHSENIADPDNMKNGVFTNDGKHVVVPFKDGTTIKARIIDLLAKTATTMPLVTGLPSDWIYYHLEMASDGKRGVVTVSGGDFIKSKTYVFDIKTGIVNDPFENNDDNVSSVYAW